MRTQDTRHAHTRATHAPPPKHTPQIKQGDVFDSETDTEVIPKLLRYVYAGMPRGTTFVELVMDVLDQLEGTYGLLIKSAHFPGELIACKRGSPLLLGVLRRRALHLHGGGGEPQSVGRKQPHPGVEPGAHTAQPNGCVEWIAGHSPAAAWKGLNATGLLLCGADCRPQARGCVEWIAGQSPTGRVEWIAGHCLVSL